MVFGLLFLSFAFYQILRNGFHLPDLLFWGMGATFLVYGGILFYRISTIDSRR